jgi:hypothetical protein
MEVNNIDDLIKLAGLVNSQAPTATAESEVEEADCGCSDEQPAAVMTNSPDMYAILKRLAQMGEVHEEEPVAEWSNSPADELTGEPESRIMDLPKGEPVDTSLRRHMGAKAQPVRVEEGIVDHTVEDMMESYAAFKLNEATKGCADCEYMKDETDGEIDTCDECAAEERAEAHKVNEAAECKYCGGDCPNDEEHACDGYLGDIDGLYEAGPEANEDAGKVGYMEMFFTDRDGGEVSHEVEVTLKDGKLSITGNMPGPEDDLYYDESDIEEQLRDAMQDMSVISWMNEDITEDPSKPNFPQTVELAGDSIWDRETPNPKTVTVTDYEMEADKDGYVHVKVMHDGPWTIYTDTGFEKAISEMIGMKVSFTEQGMQEEGVASLESGDDMDEDISILKRNAGVA